MFHIGNKVTPGPFFPYGEFDLNRNCIGQVVAVNGDNVTIDWNPGGESQQGEYKADQLYLHTEQ